MQATVICPERPCGKEFEIDTETEFLTAKLEDGGSSIFYQRQCPHCKEWVTVQRPARRRSTSARCAGRGAKRSKRTVAAKARRSPAKARRK